jgi:hypothetical protein
MQTLRQAAVARASTTLNINQQVGASIGTAVMSVLLANEVKSRLGGSGGIGAASAVSPEQHAKIAGPLADAFAATYLVGACARRDRVLHRDAPAAEAAPAPVGDPATDEAARAPVLVH